MSEKIATPRDIFGWTVGTVITTGVTGTIGWFTGSFPVVWEFAASHALEAGLWTALFFLIGVVLGMLIRGHFAKKRISELEKRSTQRLEEQKVESILSSLDNDKLGLVGMVLTRGSIDEHIEKGNRAFLAESGILVRVEPSTIEAFASYTLTSIASTVIAGDEALRESAMKQGNELVRRIDERSEKAQVEHAARRRLIETAARVPELERRAETAEAKLREYESEFDLGRFSPEQKRAMLKCWTIEQRGEEGGVMAEWNNPVCDALVDAGVFRCSADRVQGWNYQFNFEPRWRKYLAEHIGDLESEVGPIESLV